MPTHSLLLTAVVGLLTVSAPSPVAATAPGGVPPKAPPGMVQVQGGRIKVGTTAKDVEPLVVANETMASFLVAETPQVSMQIDDFFLMVSEVTNEQFAAFVSATSWHPPYTWGGAAIEEARKAWFEEDNRKRQDAKAAGKRYTASDKFDPERWWEENWKDAAWAVPDEIAEHPVTYVAYEDAVAYTRWAGVRLMTEFEYQCAGRGTSDNAYPWGKDWDAKKVACLDAGRDKTWPIASFPAGARNGIYDLAGNVWEWTSSPYTMYDGHKALEFTIKRGKDKAKVSPLAPFDANHRVLVGGSVHSGPLALRLTVRMPSMRSQRTNAVGFRCAASTKSGRDLAEYLITDAIPGTVLPMDVKYQPETPLLLQRWTSEMPTADKSGTALPEPKDSEGQEGAANAPTRPPGYSIITGYDAMLFVPAAELDAADEKALKAASLANPAHIGLLFLTKPLVDPKLEPGAYMLAYRDVGELPKLAEDAEPPAWYATPGLDPLKASYLIFDATGAPVTAWPLKTPLSIGNMAEGSAKLEPFVMPTKVAKDAPPPVPLDTLRFFAKVQSRQRSKGFVFDMPFKVEPGTIDASWHN